MFNRYSLDGIVFSASLWGGPDIDMSWLDGMTGCQGVCNLEESSVTFRNFALVKNTQKFVNIANVLVMEINLEIEYSQGSRETF